MKKFSLINLSALILVVTVFFSCKKSADVVPTDDTTIGKVINGTKRTVVVIGSSTAAGNGASTIDSSWVSRLNSQLMANYQTKVINLAVPGFTTYDVMPTGFVPGASRNAPKVANNITKALSYNPDLVIINLPSNDIALGYSDKEIMSNFDMLTSLLDSLQVPYILTGTQPRNFADQATRDRLKTLDQQLNSVYTTHVNDYYNQLADASGYLKSDINCGDGIHPNNKGHRLIYESFFKFALFLKLINN